jgi:hypothetical protein
MSSSCFRANVGCDSLGAMRPIGTLAADLHVGPLKKPPREERCPGKGQVAYAASCLSGATGSLTKKVSASMGNVTSQALPGFSRAAISKARSMLSACTATLKRAAPLLTWTEILIICPHLPSARSS